MRAQAYPCLLHLGTASSDPQEHNRLVNLHMNWDRPVLIHLVNKLLKANLILLYTTIFCKENKLPAGVLPRRVGESGRIAQTLITSRHQTDLVVPDWYASRRVSTIPGMSPTAVYSMLVLGYFLSEEAGAPCRCWLQSQMSQWQFVVCVCDLFFQVKKTPRGRGKKALARSCLGFPRLLLRKGR